MTSISKTPSVSVCVPVYNGAAFLPRLFSCLGDQEFRDFEVVVVDDGSSDGSADEARRLLAHHNLRGRIIRTENRGESRARDLACDSGQAELLAPLDCDDWWEPNYLERMVAVLRAHAAVDLVYCDLLELFPDGRSIRKSDVATWIDTARAESARDIHVFQKGAFFELLLRGQVLFPSCTVYRKTLYQEAGGYAAKLFKLRTSLDWYFGLRAARAGSVAFLKEPMLKKYVRADSVSNASFIKTESSSVCILQDILKDPTLRPAERHNARWRGAFISCACAYEAWATHRQQGQAMKWLFTSLRFEFTWRAAALALKILIPRALVEKIRPSGVAVVPGKP